MFRRFHVVLILSLVALLGLASWRASEPGLIGAPAASALAANDAAGVAEFMLVVHGPKGLRTQIQEALVGSGPEDDKTWKNVHARAAIVTFLTESILQKSSPDKGDKGSWKAKVNEYLAVARALTRAAAEKDSTGAKAQLGKLSKSCEGCHKAHR